MQFTNIQDLFIHGSISHQINRVDWERVNTLSDSSLSAEDELTVRRIRHSVRRGWITVFS